MKIWIDDVREAPEGYIWCKSTNEALRLTIFNINDVEILHLDHDMGDTFGGDAIIILNELERKSHRNSEFAEAVKNIIFILHSANPVGVANMRRIIQKNNWREAFNG
jgi:hypothetical protein